MRKVLLLGALTLGLVGCGSSSNEEVTELKKQNAQQQTQIEELQAQIADLTVQLNDLSTVTTPQTEEPAETDEATAFIIQTLSTDGNTYTRTEIKVELKEKENEYEAMLRTMFPELTFNEVSMNDDATITIDVHENSTSSPNMTSSAQVSMFFDQLVYTLVENFPQLQGYYLTSNGEATYMGDTGPYDGLQPLASINESELYLPINE